jgi:hypothetical protein
MIAALFFTPITISSSLELWLVLPLCAAVGLIYKTIRVERMALLPMEFIRLTAYMIAGLTLLCAALWAIHTYWPSIS